MKNIVKTNIKKVINISIRPFIGIINRVFPNRKIKKIIKNHNNVFFGYYNIKPWSKNENYIICLKVNNILGHSDNVSEAKVMLINMNTGEETIVDTTHCWNTQQGCMLQWLGPSFNEKIIYNDFANERFISKIYNIKTHKIEKIIDYPIYCVSSDGKFAFSLDFTRLHFLRPGYGYSNIECKTKKQLCPNKQALYRVDLETNTIKEICTYKDLYNFEFREDMKNSFHKINHICINPSNNRIMFIHRWINNEKKYSRLITCDINGDDMFNLSDDNMVSHCCWKNDNEILGYLRKKEEGDHYYLLKDKTNNYRVIWRTIIEDGHCSYSEDGNYIISDTYPNIFGISKVLLGTENDSKPKVVSSFFSPSWYKDDLRCDLHPRWNYSGNMVCVDSVKDNYKKIYLIDVTEDINEKK